MNRLLASLRPHRSHDEGVRPAPAAGQAAADAQAHEEPVGACGWFDSSHALQHGLQVTEHASADALGEELPLVDWLQFHLGGWAAVPGAAQARCGQAATR